jgi:hypothetical protein
MIEVFPAVPLYESSAFNFYQRRGLDDGEVKDIYKKSTLL